MATPTKTIRLRPELRTGIERIARRTRRSFSEVAQTLIDEALRMHACPGIYFADEPAGRVAKVAGTGLGVWEIIQIYQSVKGNETKLRKRTPHVSLAQLKAALLYYAKFRQEVEAEIGDNRVAFGEGHATRAATPGHA